MRRNRVALGLLTLLIPMLLGGCWDRRDVEEVAFVLALGIDRGELSRYKVTVSIARPAQSGGNEGAGNGTVLITTVDAPSVVSALTMIDSYVSRQVSLLHTKALFISEELARENGLQTLDEFVRFRQARRTIFYIVTKGSAGRFLREMKPVIEQSPQRFIEQLTYNASHTGTIPESSQIHTFVTTVNTGYREPISYYAALREDAEDGSEGSKRENGREPAGLDPFGAESGFTAGRLPRTGGTNVEMIGAAAFRNQRMIGVLTGEEVRLFLMTRDQFRRGIFSIADPMEPDRFVSLELHQSRPYRLDVDLTGEHPRVRGRITLEGELMAVEGRTDYTLPETKVKLGEAAAQHITQELTKLVAKTQEWEADVIGFGNFVARQFSTVQAWEEYDWPNRYPDAEVTMEVVVDIRRYGLQLSPPKSR